MRLREIGSILIEAATRFGQDHAPRLGAALAFYAVMSLAPLLFVLTAIAGQVFGAEAVRGEIVAQIQDVVGREAAVLIEDVVRRAAIEAEGWLMVAIGVAGLLFGASIVLIQLKLALNSIWGLEPERGGGVLHAIKDFVLMRLIAFGVMIGLGLLVMLSLLASTAVDALATWFDELLPLPAIWLRLLNIGVWLGILTLLFAYIYRTLPDVRIRWAEVWLGAIVTAILFTIGKELIAIYMARGAVGSAYGAAGALVVLLFWIYYSALIFFFGAEITQVYALRYGSGWRGRRGFRVTDEGLAIKEAPRPEGARPDS